MGLIDNLVAAMLRSDGQALVLHVGEKPYVVADSGAVELSPRELTLEAIEPMLEQLLTPGSRSQLQEFGAVQDDLPAVAGSSDRFTIVAARGGADIWIELRRQRVAPPEPEPVVEPPVPEPTPIPVEQPRASSAADDATLALDAGEIEDEDISKILGPKTRKALHLIEPEARRAPPPAAAAPAPVVPMRPRAVERPPDRAPVRAGGEAGTDLERLLRLAVSRHATTLYVVTDTKPALRVEGEVRTLDTEPPLTGADIEALVLAMLPEGDALRKGTEADWMRDVPDIGRVRCTRFRDHRGPGAIFQIIGGRPVSADDLGLPRAVRELADERDGLVVITGPRASGKSTLFASLVDLINRTRSAHIITLEAQITVVHQNRTSIVSQREVRGDPEALLTMTRAALREGPDVLAIEDLRARDVVGLALQAAESGRLVLGTLAAPGAAAAIERLIDQGSDERQTLMQRTLAETLRGVVAQVLVRRMGGGRVPAREIVRNTPPVSNLIVEGNLSRLASAFEHGRRAGMVSLNDALLDLVRGKIVDVQEAYRHSSDRDALVKLLEREGIDTSFVERMA